MGLEYLSQPQVFLSPITAVGGIQNGLYDSPVPPLFTSFYTWTSTSEVTATTFPLTGIETLTNRSGSFIVTVGGVVQSPTTYTIDVLNRTLTFDTPVNDNTDVLITQIGTIAVSAQSLSELTANNSFFSNIIGINSLLTNITAIDSRLLNVTATNLRVLSSQFFGTTVFNTVTATNLVVLSAVTQVQQTIITPTSGVSLTAIGTALFKGPISATDVATIDQDLTVGGTIYTINGDSNIWNYNTTLLQSNSANWISARSTLNSLSSNWQTTYQTVCSLSSNWEVGYNAGLAYQSLSSSFATNTTLCAVSSLLLPSSVYQETSGSFATNTALNATSSVLLPTSIYQNASGNWQSTYQTVCALSASWEESADILPTVTNYLSTNLVTVSSLNVTNQLLSANTNLFNIFLTPNNTLTTSICAISGDGVTPFVMQFTNGLLTSLTV